MIKLLIYDEYISSKPEIIYFKSINEIYKYILDFINNDLEDQKLYISGLKGIKECHLKKYKNYLISNNKLYYYGEYSEYKKEKPYLLKFIIDRNTI